MCIKTDFLKSCSLIELTFWRKKKKKDLRNRKAYGVLKVGGAVKKTKTKKQRKEEWGGMESYWRQALLRTKQLYRQETQAGPGGGEGRETAAIGRMWPHSEDFGLGHQVVLSNCEGSQQGQWELLYSNRAGLGLGAGAPALQLRSPVSVTSASQGEKDFRKSQSFSLVTVKSKRPN